MGFIWLMARFDSIQQPSACHKYDILATLCIAQII